jgi:hypothetical protein
MPVSKHHRKKRPNKVWKRLQNLRKQALKNWKADERKDAKVSKKV